MTGILDLDVALTSLAERDPLKADVVKLRYFAGLDRDEIAATLDIYLDADGRFVPERSLNGPLAAGIPGSPAALAHGEAQAVAVAVDAEIDEADRGDAEQVIIIRKKTDDGI